MKDKYNKKLVGKTFIVKLVDNSPSLEYTFLESYLENCCHLSWTIEGSISYSIL